MIIAFFKSHYEEQCLCEIVKFTDRIWVDKSGDISCIRTFIVGVDEQSPVPLTIVRMFSPFREIYELEDLSFTCMDENYLYNKKRFSTGGYRIKTVSPEKDYGTVDYDFFNDVEVYTQALMKTYPAKDGDGLVISCESPKVPILPGKFRMIRLKFKLKSQLEELFPRVYSFSMTYFSKRVYQETYKLMNIENLLIKVKKIYDPSIRQGGFDIFLYLTKDLSSSSFNATTITVGKHLPNGKEGEESTQKFIWRARKIFEDPAIEYLEPEKTRIELEGLINDPYELEEIRNDICKLQDGNNKNLHLGWFALGFALFTLIVTLLLNDDIRGYFIPPAPQATDTAPQATEGDSGIIKDKQ